MSTPSLASSSLARKKIAPDGNTPACVTERLRAPNTPARSNITALNNEDYLSILVPIKSCCF